MAHIDIDFLLEINVEFLYNCSFNNSHVTITAKRLIDNMDLQLNVSAYQVRPGACAAARWGGYNLEKCGGPGDPPPHENPRICFKICMQLKGVRNPPFARTCGTCLHGPHVEECRKLDGGCNARQTAWWGTQLNGIGSACSLVFPWWGTGRHIMCTSTLIIVCAAAWSIAYMYVLMIA